MTGSTFESRVESLINKLGSDIAALAKDDAEYINGLTHAAMVLLDQVAESEEDEYFVPPYTYMDLDEDEEDWDDYEDDIDSLNLFDVDDEDEELPAQ